MSHLESTERPKNVTAGHSGARGVNLIGHVSGNLGLGVACRLTAGLLHDLGVPFVTIDIPTAVQPRRSASEWISHEWSQPGAAPYRVNLFHLNPPELRTQVRCRPPWLKVDGRLNAIVPYWELSEFPPVWIDIMNRMDVVLAPTRFIETLATATLSKPKILHLPPTTKIPEAVQANRPRWCFGERDVVFISSFDLNSDLSRKNPHGTVRAFQRMRDGLDAVTAKRARLVIKVNNPEHSRSQAARLRELHELVAGDAAITLIAESLPYSDVLSLYASADVFVSLHRGEGLGLGLLESMMLGVPVVATAYSGNLDFMTPNDSKLIQYRLVPVSGTSIGSYSVARMGPHQMWAEPDEVDAARAMGELMDDEHRATLGAAAKAAALATHSNPARAAAIETLLGYSQSAPALSELAGLQDRPAGYWRARASAAGTLRRLGLVD